MNSDQTQQVDLFDLLPDALLFEIFNKVQDTKSLSTCSSLCKRFNSLIPQTYNLHLTIPRRSTSTRMNRSEITKHNFKTLVNKFFVKPIRFLVQRMVSKTSTDSCSHCDCDEDDFSFRLPNKMLKNFTEIRSLRVKLPSHEGDVSSSNGGDGLLKWKAEFGKDLESCVMLGASSFIKSQNVVSHNSNGEKQDENHEISLTDFTNEKLKQRLVWTISCLIAASARHHMLKQIISENPTIREAEITDGSKQGRICMKNHQIEELRNAMDFPEVEMDRTPVPALKIKMWYVPVLELPASGYVMKGATLAVIRPATLAGENGSPASGSGSSDVELAMDAFGGGRDEEEGCFGEAFRKMIKKKKAYILEMNSF